MSNNYNPTKWIGGKTIGTADVMNNMEEGILNAHQKVDVLDSQIKEIETRIDNIGGSSGGNVDLSGYVTKEIGNGTWDGGHLVMRNRHIWIDSTGKIRLKNGSPTSDTDGIEVSLGS